MATSFMPFELDAMPFQSFGAPMELSSVHVLAESVEIQMLPGKPRPYPPETTAASLVPFDDDAMPRHRIGAPTDVSSVKTSGFFVGASVGAVVGVWVAVGAGQSSVEYHTAGPSPESASAPM